MPGASDQARGSSQEPEHEKRAEPGKARLGSGSVARPLALEPDSEADQSRDRNSESRRELNVGDFHRETCYDTNRCRAIATGIREGFHDRRGVSSPIHEGEADDNS